MINIKSRVLGCLLGGAIGDALGAPIEFMKWDQIKQNYGNNGVEDYQEAYGRKGAITDDTQMTLFTAEALIRAQNRWERKGICNPIAVIRNAYLRWLHTQGETQLSDIRSREYINSGWLITNNELHHRRAPGNTVLASLRHPNSHRNLNAENNSKGCGGIMRVAPIGLMMARDPFGMASDAARITHGHPTGYLSAGVLSMIIHNIMDNKSLEDAIGIATSILKVYPGHEETLAAIEKAVILSKTSSLSVDNIELLGLGWIAEEALAIALFCALKAEDFKSGILAAVNHSGDSDSTGSICGNILGSILGIDKIPGHWLNNLEARDVIEQLGYDLIQMFFGHSEKGLCDIDRYPGN